MHDAIDNTSATYYTVSVIALAVLVYTTWRLWPSPTPPGQHPDHTPPQPNDHIRAREQARSRLRWPALTVLTLITVIEFSAAPATIGWLNKLTGVPNFAALWVYCLLDALACSAIVLIAYLRDPAEQARTVTRRTIAAYAVAITGLIVLFALGRAPVEHRVDFDTTYARTAFISAFILVYLLAYGWGAAVVAVMTWRWASVATRPWLRPGLRLVAAGSGMGVAFTISKLTAVCARMIANRDLDYLSSTTAPALSALAVMFFGAGFALPALGERITRIRAWLDRWARYRALSPLWQAVSTVAPSPGGTFPLPRWDLDVRVTARTSMIRDAQIALRQHLNPIVTTQAYAATTDTALDNKHRDAVIAAIQIAAALDARRAGLTYAANDNTHYPDHGGIDGVTELQWLALVSEAFASSPLVAHLAHTAPHHTPTNDNAGSDAAPASDAPATNGAGSADADSKDAAHTPTFHADKPRDS